MSVPILKTKLHHPSTPRNLVKRPALIQKLNEGLEAGRSITLVSAPAGFGKTTCISEWVSRLNLPIAWLSLDHSDDDPARFLLYLIKALKTINPEIGKEIEAVISAGQIPPSEVASAGIINDILNFNSQFLLVLDDFHLIQDHRILKVMENLVNNHPWPLHLVFLTREDPSLPLARLRANNQLTEIRARDLRFSGDDIQAFLNGIMGLSLSSKDLAILEQKTEGWIASIQLVGLSLKDVNNPSNFIAGLNGSHRFILSYLTEQVLNQQPEPVRDFLFQTAILDEFNSDLCKAVTSRPDALEMLEHLCKTNLFLIPLDDYNQWYRYHHLFSDLLRVSQRTRPVQDLRERHQRASQWFADAGMAIEAVHHALAAEDFNLVVELIEAHAVTMIMQGHAKTVNAWVQAIPENLRSRSPKTHLAFAWMHLLRGAYPEASSFLQEVEEVSSFKEVDQEEKNALKAEWLVMKSLLLTMGGSVDESLALVQEALRIVPEHDIRIRSMIHFGLACNYQTRDDYDRVVDEYQKAIQYGEFSGNYVTQMLSTSGLAQLAFEYGQLHTAFKISKPVCDQLEKAPTLPPIGTVVFGVIGDIYYQWNQPKQARRYFQNAYQLSALGGLNSGMINCLVLLSRTSLLEGDMSAAADEIQRSVELIKTEVPAYVHQEVAAQRVRVLLGQDQAEAAENVLVKMGFSFGDQFSYPELKEFDRISYSLGLLYNSSMHLLLHKGSGDQNARILESGLELAGLLIDNLGSQPVQTRLEALLLRARIQYQLGDIQSSQADLLEALRSGQPGGYFGVFVEQGSFTAGMLSNLLEMELVPADLRDYAQKVYKATSQQRTKSMQTMPLKPPGRAIPEMIIPLTDRELEVLCLMAEGLTYKEVAERLFITLNTVRYHVKAIYGKLNVNNRTQAIESARQLGIL